MLIQLLCPGNDRSNERPEQQRATALAPLVAAGAAVDFGAALDRGGRVDVAPPVVAVPAAQ